MTSSLLLGEFFWTREFHPSDAIAVFIWSWSDDKAWSCLLFGGKKLLGHLQWVLIGVYGRPLLLLWEQPLPFLSVSYSIQKVLWLLFISSSSVEEGSPSVPYCSVLSACCIFFHIFFPLRQLDLKIFAFSTLTEEVYSSLLFPLCYNKRTLLC